MENETKQYTIKELAAKFGVDYITASGFVNFLVAASDLKSTKKPKAPGERGKSSLLFEFPQVIEIQIWGDETQVNETENQITGESHSEIAELLNSPMETLETVPTESAPIVAESISIVN